MNPTTEQLRTTVKDSLLSALAAMDCPLGESQRTAMALLHTRKANAALQFLERRLAGVKEPEVTQ